MFVKMSGGWFCKEIDSLSAQQRNIVAHIDNGEIVAFSDDVETFASEMEIEVEDIEMAI
jgi:hypothetical protein